MKDEQEMETDSKTLLLEDASQQYDEGLIYGTDELRKKPSMAFDEGLIYGVNVLKNEDESPSLEEDYDSGLITDDAEERFRATNMRTDVQVQGNRVKANRKSMIRRSRSVQVESKDEYDSGLITDEAEENYRIVYMDKEVQTDRADILEKVQAGDEDVAQINPNTRNSEDEKNKLLIEVKDTTDDDTTDQANDKKVVPKKDDSDGSMSTISRVSTPTMQTRPVTVTKVSQQVDESEYENTTADEKPLMPIRKKIDPMMKRFDKVTIVEKIPIRRSTVSLADRHDKSADEASDSYDADYESYDNDDDDGDSYEPTEISLADTLICVGFGYALVYT